MMPAQALIAAVMRACGTTEVRLPEKWVTDPVGDMETWRDDRTGEMVIRYRPPETGEDLP